MSEEKKDEVIGPPDGAEDRIVEQWYEIEVRRVTRRRTWKPEWNYQAKAYVYSRVDADEKTVLLFRKAGDVEIDNEGVSIG